MNGSYPIIDERRAKELYEELRTIAGVALPEWQGGEEEGEYGNALLKIVARLAEHLTKRMDQTPMRDKAEFYRQLDIPADWARPAIAPLVLQLAENRLAPVFARARTQVAAVTEQGEVIFETQNALQLAPGRLESLLVADTDKDRIEKSPPGFLQLAPPEVLQVEYKAVTAASVDSKILQIEPTEGLEAGDLIRLEVCPSESKDQGESGPQSTEPEALDKVYHIAGKKDELFTLVEPLAGDVRANTPVEKISRFDVLEMRDLQEHIVYIGHSELLNLDKAAAIRLTISPAGVVDEINQTDSAPGDEIKYCWELYGIDKSQTEADAKWQPLHVCEETGDGSTGTPGDSSASDSGDACASSGEEEPGIGIVSQKSSATITLVKGWEGPVKEFEVNGEKSRWLRLVRRTPITTRTVKNTRTNAINISSESPPCVGIHCNGALPADEDRRDTISQAFYNNTPLLPSPFFPFGTEPQRFDTFALAAPEALSKPGARVTLKIALSNALLVNMSVVKAQTQGGDLRAYAITDSGELASLTFVNAELVWRVLDAPSSTTATNLPDVTDDSTSLSFLLSESTEVQALQLANISSADIATARDRNKRAWLRTVRLGEGTGQQSSQRNWHLMPDLPEGLTDTGKDLVIVGQQEKENRAFVVAVAGNSERSALYGLTVEITVFGVLDVSFPGGWREVNTNSAQEPKPNFSADSRVELIKKPRWPNDPAAIPADILVVDANKSLWVGRISLGEDTSELSVVWRRLQRQQTPVGAYLTAENALIPRAAYYQETQVTGEQLEGVDRLAIFAARLKSGENDRYTPVAINLLVEENPENVPGPRFTCEGGQCEIENDSITLDEASTIQIFPRLDPSIAESGIESSVTVPPLGAFLAVGGQSPSIDIWSPVGRIENLVVPAGFLPSVPASALLAFIDNAKPAIIFAGQQQSLNGYRLPNTINYDVFNGLVFDTMQIDFVEDITGQLLVPLTESMEVGASGLAELVMSKADAETGEPVYIYRVKRLSERSPVEPSVPVRPGDWNINVIQQSLSGEDCPGSDSQMQLDEADTDTGAGSKLQIFDVTKGENELNQLYIIKDDPIPLVHAAETNKPLPGSIDPACAVVYTGSKPDESKPQDMRLDTEDQETTVGHDLRIGAILYNVAQKEDRDVSLTLALPAGPQISYEIQGAPESYEGRRIDHNRMERDSTDETSLSGSVLVIEGEQFTVDSISRDTVNGIDILELVPPDKPLQNGNINYQNVRLPFLSYRVLYEGSPRENELRNILLDAADVKVKVNDVMIIDETEYVVQRLIEKKVETIAVLSDGSFPLPKGEILYTYRDPVFFQGEAEVESELILDKQDRKTIMTHELSIDGNIYYVVARNSDTAPTKSDTALLQSALPLGPTLEYRIDAEEQNPSSGTRESHNTMQLAPDDRRPFLDEEILINDKNYIVLGLDEPSENLRIVQVALALPRDAVENLTILGDPNPPQEGYTWEREGYNKLIVGETTPPLTTDNVLIFGTLHFAVARIDTDNPREIEVTEGLFPLPVNQPQIQYENLNDYHGQRFAKESKSFVVDMRDKDTEKRDQIRINNYDKTDEDPLPTVEFDLFYVEDLLVSGEEPDQEKQAELVWALPEESPLKYRNLTQGDMDYREGQKDSNNTLELYSEDEETKQFDELLIENRNYFVAEIIDDPQRRVVRLCLALPKDNSEKYSEIGGSGLKEYEWSRRDGIEGAAPYKEMQLNTIPNGFAQGSIICIGELQYTVVNFDDTNNIATVSAGVLCLPSDRDPVIYDNLRKEPFCGRRGDNKQLQFNNEDEIIGAGNLFIIGEEIYQIKKAGRCDNLVVLRDKYGAVKNLPERPGEPEEPAEINYDLLATVVPSPDYSADKKHLYRLAWPVDLNSAEGTLLQLRYLSLAGDVQNIIFQDVVFSEIDAPDPGSDDEPINWVFVDSDTEVNTIKGVIDLITTESQQWTTEAFPDNTQNPELSWEYFDGKSWQKLEKNDFLDFTDYLSRSGDIRFRVPDDLSPTEIAGKQDYWIRARLIGGDYGRPIFRVITAPGDQEDESTQEIQVDTTQINAPRIISIEASFKLDAGPPPEHLLVQNNLDFRIQTQANREPNAEFELFEGVKKINEYQDQSQEVPQAADPESPSCPEPEPPENNQRPARRRAMYFGFTKPFDVSPLSLYIDAVDQDQQTTLTFEVLVNLGSENDWLRISATDDTFGMNRRGYIQVFVNSEPVLARLFGQELYWLRASPTDEDACEWQPSLRGVYANAGSVRQVLTFRQEVLGSSIGEPGLALSFANQPVLPDSLELRVRETLGEEELEALNANAQVGAPMPVAFYDQRADDPQDDISLQGDWVLWQRVDSFLGRGPDERIYRLDIENGVIAFGDDREGRIPPAGADNIRAIFYETGGGLEGNVAAYTITDLKTALQAVDEIANPIAAAGGTALPSLDAQLLAAPANLRRSRQGITAQDTESKMALACPDIEALVVASSPDLVRARCLPLESAAAPLRVAIAQRTGERCPAASLATRTQLARLVLSQAWGGLDDTDLLIINPDYVRMEVRIRLLATSVDTAAALEQAATERLRLLFDPIEGGPGGQPGEPPGWPFGRTVYPSDIYRALADIPQLDRVAELERLAEKPEVDTPSLCDPPPEPTEPPDPPEPPPPSPPAVSSPVLEPHQLICADETDIVVSVEISTEAYLP